MNCTQTGSIVRAKHDTPKWRKGEVAVCYEVYRIGVRPGFSFIFEGGFYDGFSPDELDTMLERTGEVCPEVADYEFTNVIKLDQDFKNGRFAPAWSV